MGDASDFNDLMQIAGPDAVRADVDKALAGAVQTSAPGADPNPLTPPQMRPEGFPPLLRAICDAACANSEAHPVAVAVNVLAFFCAMVGRTAFQRIGDGIIHCRVFAIIAGKSGKARKGTSETLVRELFRMVDTIVRKRLGTDARLRIHAGGLSTGEGIAYAIRDAREPDDGGKGGDAGVADKRLLVVEAEFANGMAHCRREGNTLSPTIRNLWDGRDLEPLTKSSPTCASNPHVVLVGHITGQELRERATEGDVTNGLLNRFMISFVYRPKLVPLPSPTPRAALDGLAARLAAAVEFAATNTAVARIGKADTVPPDLLANNTHEVRMGDDAAAVWCNLYPGLSRDRDGKIGSLLARTEVYARMLAMVFAVMDCRDEIEPCDLYAAVAWIDYWTESAAFIFRAGDGDDDQISDFDAEVLGVIRKSPGIKLDDIQAHWSRKKIKPVRAALEKLGGVAPPMIVGRKEAVGAGRPAMRYYPA